MKKTVLSLVLVVAMLMSCVCTVGAAGLGLAALKTLAESRPSLVYGDISLSADDATYVDTLSVTETTEFYAKATLDMSKVKEDIVKVYQELDPAHHSTLDAKKVSGEFTIKVNIGSGVYVIPDAASTDAAMAGFSFEDSTGNPASGNLFVEDGARVKSGDFSTGHTITVTVKVNDKFDGVNDTTVADLASIPDKINFTYGGLKAVADTTVGGTITGSVTIHDIDGVSDAVINFTFVDANDTSVAIQPAIVDLPALPSGGGGGITPKPETPKYTIKYETDGGTTYKDETYAENKAVKIDKVPTKEGYVFDGWYADAKLTEEIDSVTVTKDTTVYAKWVKERHPVPENLNGVDHFAYVIGYPDGTVRPNDNITRAEVTTIFFRLLKDEVRDAVITNENSFDDVSLDDWHNVAISTMAKLGIVNGRFEDRFVPDANITRAEFTAICARFDTTEVEYEGSFKDINGHWAEEYIKRASAYGWIEGYSDNTFRPDQFITRAEAMTLINRVLNRIPRDAEDLLHDDMAIWSDNMDPSKWFYIAVQEATNSTEYERPNSLYKTWTEVVENRDWSEYQK